MNLNILIQKLLFVIFLASLINFVKSEEDINNKQITYNENER
jgi:hypothetical protein